MTGNETINLPASCGSVQDLTNPDFCGIGVLASYTLGVGLLFLHQLAFQISACTSRRKNTLTQDEYDDANTQHRHVSDTKRFQLGASIAASSISLYDTAIVLAISWQIAALLSLNTSSSVQTTHDVLLVCLTAYASIAISLGALCTSFDHIRRHKYRFGFCLFSLILCIAVTGLGQQIMVEDNFPKEICLPFFNDYKPNMRKYFVVLSAVFWITSIIMIVTLLTPSTRTKDVATWNLTGSRLHRYCVASWKFYVVFAAEMLLLVMTVLVNHYFVPEQVLRAQAGGQLAESQWTFGQIVGMLIWAPVLVEFGYVFCFGPKEGLEGRLPVEYIVCSQTSGNPAMRLSRGQRQPSRNGFSRMGP